jgi:hypothetical protein
VIAAQNDMIDGTGKMDAGFSGHGGTLWSIPHLSSLTPFPRAECADLFSFIMH